MKRISVVIPIYNEEASLEELIRRLTTTFKTALSAYACNVIFVNDGSSDRSRQLLDLFCEKEENCNVLHFTRNFGQQPAFFAGLAHADGDYIVLMDGDLQNPPEEIPVLVRQIEQGYEVVYGVRTHRKDSLLRLIGSKFYHSLMSFLLGVKIIDITAFRIISQKVAHTVVPLATTTSNVSALIAWMGFKSSSVAVKHDKRAAGKSHYSLWGLIEITVESVMNFSPNILRCITLLGLITSCISFCLGFYFIALKLACCQPLPGFTSIVVLITFFFGINFIFLGAVGEYIAKIFQFSLARPSYIVDTCTQCCNKECKK